jgi:hypothetical protein
MMLKTGDSLGTRECDGEPFPDPLKSGRARVMEACYRHGLLFSANGTFEAETGDDCMS